MHLIIGGAYQGKLMYAKKQYGFTDEQIFSCDTSQKIDFSFPCIRHIEEYVYGCVQRGEDPVEYFRGKRDLWAHSVLLCRDIACGVVPVTPEERAWREKVGLLTQYLSENAEHISRVFCGIEQRLK